MNAIKIRNRLSRCCPIGQRCTLSCVGTCYPIILESTKCPANVDRRQACIGAEHT